MSKEWQEAANEYVKVRQMLYGLSAILWGTGLTGLLYSARRSSPLPVRPPRATPARDTSRALLPTSRRVQMESAWRVGSSPPPARRMYSADGLHRRPPCRISLPMKSRALSPVSWGILSLCVLLYAHQFRKEMYPVLRYNQCRISFVA